MKERKLINRKWKKFLFWEITFMFSLQRKSHNFFCFSFYFQPILLMQTFDFFISPNLIMIFYICGKKCLYSKSQICVIIPCLFVRRKSRSNKHREEADFLTISRRHEATSRQIEDNGADARANCRLNEVSWV